MIALFERLGFTHGAAASLEGNDHDINTLEEVVFLNDKDIVSLVKNFRRPGGLIAGPWVANPGHYVSISADTNLKLAVLLAPSSTDFDNCGACKRCTNSCAPLALNQGI
jgi:hypothetical protein